MKKELLRIYKIIFTLIVFILIYSCPISNPANNSDNEKDTLITSNMVLTSSTLALSLDTYSIDYSIGSDWGSGFVTDVKISNNTSTVINGWELKWTFSGNQNIINLWNENVSQSVQDVTVTNAFWNTIIPANGQVNFGFQAEYSGTNTVPGEFELSSSSSSSSSYTLRELADSKNLIFAATASSSYMNETNYTDTLKNEFNCLVAENDMKFSYLEPSENNFTYSTADELVDFANTNSMKVRGHALLWHSD